MDLLQWHCNYRCCLGKLYIGYGHDISDAKHAVMPAQGDYASRRLVSRLLAAVC